MASPCVFAIETSKRSCARKSVPIRPRTACTPPNTSSANSGPRRPPSQLTNCARTRRGDAVGRQLRFAGDQTALDVLHRPAARREVLLEGVAMQIDHSRQDQESRQIDLAP